MWDNTAVTILILIQLSLHLIVAVVHKYQWLRFIDKKETEWAAERKDLMDRIQAPSFAEYANKVVREKQAEQQEEEETPIEFIS